ncbi:MAG: hypothetical protein ACP5C3_05390 [Methanomicrobiales archaeon]
MGPLELFAILVLAGAIVVLLYYYLQENKIVNLGGVRKQVSEAGDKVSGQFSKAGEKIPINYEETGEKVSGVSEKMSGVGEKVSGVSDKIMGKVRDVPISTDILSNRIESFLDEQSDQLIKDWELATKTDIKDLEKRFEKATRDIDELERRFNEYRGFTNKKLDAIDERLKKLEEPEE